MRQTFRRRSGAGPDLKVFGEEYPADARPQGFILTAGQPGDYPIAVWSKAQWEALPPCERPEDALPLADGGAIVYLPSPDFP